MALYFRLNKQIVPETLLKKVQKELSEHNAGPDDVLVIEVKKTTQLLENITKEQVRKYLSNDRKKEV
jgi:hypothetical protein